MMLRVADKHADPAMRAAGERLAKGEGWWEAAQKAYGEFGRKE